MNQYCELKKLYIMQLFVKYAYTTLSDYCKFTISYVIYQNQIQIPFTKGSSLIFRENGEDYPVYDLVSEYVGIVAEEYKDAYVYSILIRIYLDGIKQGPPLNLSDDEVLMRMSSWIVYESCSNQLKAVPVGGHSKRRYSEYLTPLKGTIKEKGGFIVADTETLLIHKEDASTIENKKVNIPYAIGFLLVSPGDDLSSLTSNVIETYFSEEYPDFLYTSFSSLKIIVLRSVVVL